MQVAPTEVLTFGIITIGAGFAALVAIIVLYAAQAGPSRAGLAPVAAALSMFGPLVGIGTASKHLAQTFGDMANSGGGGAAALIDGCSRAQGLMRLGDGAAVVSLVLAAILGWRAAGSRSSRQRPQASVWRLFALSAFLISPVIAVGTLHEYVRTTNRIAVAVAEAPPAEPTEEPVVTQALVSRMTRGVLLGGLGAPALLLIVIGFAVAAALLAWKVAVPHWFRMAGTACLVAVAVLAVTAIVFFQRPVALP